MPDILAILAEATETDRQGPHDSDSPDRPDYPLMLANDRAIPLLAKLCKEAGAELCIVRAPNVSLEDVQRAMAASPDAIVTIYGHGTEPPFDACVNSRRKEPREIIADHSIVSGRHAALCVYACHSIRICEDTDTETRPVFIGFSREAYVPRLEAIERSFEPDHQEVILRAYDAAYVMPTIRLLDSKDPDKTVIECQERLIDVAEECKDLLHKTGNANFLEHILRIDDNWKRLTRL